MGARISIQFKKENEKSVVLFSHCGGEEFYDEATQYAKDLSNRMLEKNRFPLERLEPRTVMVDFIRHLTKNDKRVMGNLYLGIDENDGDNSDYGHRIIDLGAEKIENKLELEDHNFKTNSNGWKKITVAGKRYLVNDEKDIWELLDSEYKGEQLFTYDAMIRETKKRGKRVPTIDEFDKILKVKDDLKNIKYVGYRYLNGLFYNLDSDFYLWSSTPSNSSYISDSSYMCGRTSDKDYSTVLSDDLNKANGFSVRCIK